MTDDPDMFLAACAAAAALSLLFIAAWMRPSPRAMLRRFARFLRAVLPPPFSAAFARGHCVQTRCHAAVAPQRSGPLAGPLVLAVELCRCGAWRALVGRGERGTLRTRWSAPCSVPSPAKPSDGPR